MLILKIKYLFKFILFLLSHPLNKSKKWNSIKRFLFWQLGSRLLKGDVFVPFVNNAYLCIRRGMTGATGNVYTGLHEFEDMGFLLHLLRVGDLFVDVGANVGSYTVLASAVVGSNSVSIEPAPMTFSFLERNIRLNNIDSLVEALNIGVARNIGFVKFTQTLDTMNHVVPIQEICESALEVKVDTLDNILQGRNPFVLKVDVEGFETEVIGGAHKTLSNQSLSAIIIELNNSGERYGYDDYLVHSAILEYGFQAYAYDPFNRNLKLLRWEDRQPGNVIYIKDFNAVIERVKSSSKYFVVNAGAVI